jgi:hypothetical protein
VVTASATSGLAPVLTIAPASSSVCSLDGSTSGSSVTFIGVGTCTILADQAGNENWTAATQVQQAFAVGKGAQAVSITSTAPVAAAVGGTAYVVTASATSGLAPVLTIAPASSSVCSLDGSTSGSSVTFIGVGTCTILADQAGNENWTAATQVQQAFAVGAHGSTPQVITFAALVDKTYGAVPFTVSATGGGSDNPVTFASLTTGVCTTSGASGATVTIVAAGDCTVQASQDGDPTYAPATPVDRTFPVAKAALTVTADDKAITFGSPSPAFTFTYGPFVGSDGQPGIDTQPVCSVSGAHTDVAGGPYTITCSGGVDNNYDFIYVSGRLTIAKAAQGISFTSSAPASALVGQTYLVGATTTSNLAVALTIAPASSAVCWVSGWTVTFQRVGTCTILADQAGDANYTAAPQVRQDVVVYDQAPICPVGGLRAVVMNVAISAAAGCTDPEFDPLTYAIVAQAGHGTATISTTGTWTYAPAANYRGADSFTFRAGDGVLTSNLVSVSINVTNAPVRALNDGIVVITATVPATISVLANDSPGTGDTGQPLTIAAYTQGAHGRVARVGSTLTYDPTGCATGTDLFTYTISDGQYTASASVIVTIARPGTNGLSINPITDAPSVGFVLGSTIGTTVPARLAWCGVTRSASLVRGYSVMQGANGGAFATIVSGSKSTATTRNLTVGAAYRWQARTTDTAGRTGAWAASLPSKVARYQETTRSITYTGTWRSASTASASGGAQRFATAAGAKASLTLTNIRQFAIVGPRSSTRGSFEVWVDRVKVATISEKASASAYRRVLYVRGVTSGAGVSHVIEIRAVGNGRIDLDAILALS